MSHRRQRIRGLRKRWRALLQGRVIFPRGAPSARAPPKTWIYRPGRG